MDYNSCPRIPTCVVNGCNANVVMTTPDNLCAWHWQVWFAFGNVQLAELEMKHNGTEKFEDLCKEYSKILFEDFPEGTEQMRSLGFPEHLCEKL